MSVEGKCSGHFSVMVNGQCLELTWDKFIDNAQKPVWLEKANHSIKISGLHRYMF